MEKVLKYIPLGLLIAYSSKLLITGNVSLSEVGLCAILAVLTVHFDNKAENKKIKNLQEHISKLSAELSKHEQAIKNIETNVASLKLSGGFRQIGAK